MHVIINDKSSACMHSSGCQSSNFYYNVVDEIFFHSLCIILIICTCCNKYQSDSGGTYCYLDPEYRRPREGGRKGFIFIKCYCE